MLFKASTEQTWCFESGCSRHMTGEKTFSNGVPLYIQKQHVTFGDDVSTKVIRRENLNVPDLPKLIDVSLIEGLKANLINIS